MRLELNDLGLAYRKAKVDLYYSNDARPLDLLDYEEQLNEHLTDLLHQIRGKDREWVRVPEFLGTFSVMPKSITNAPEKTHAIHAAPKDAWQARIASAENGPRPSAEFRLISHCSIDFHVLAALWIGKVGAKLDAKLDDNSMGNRLRRTAEGDYNWYSSGSFTPYLHPYRRWLDDGLKAMNRALDDKKSVVAVTADATAFYHRLDAQFLESDEFLQEVLDVDLTPLERKIHSLFVTALTAWNDLVSSQLGVGRCGLPVGLPASGVVANLALIELDRFVERDVKPLHYGRYVDDIILVLEGGKTLDTEVSVWRWIESRSKNQLALKVEEASVTKVQQVKFDSKYLGESEVIFENSKNKMFFLRGASGQVLVDSIRNTVHARSSEWRALPLLPEDASDVATSLVEASQANGDPADSLRKTDAVSASRAGFALKLRDFEAYTRALDPDSWVDHRNAFFGAVRDHMLVLPHFFDLAQYTPRILKIAIACGDWDELEKLLASLDRVFRTVLDDCRVQIKAISESDEVRLEVLSRWAERIQATIEEALATSASKTLSPRTRARMLEAVHTVAGYAPDIYLSEGPSAALYRRLFLHDLGDTPFRALLLPEEMKAHEAPKLAGSLDGGSFGDWPLPAKLRESVSALARQISRSLGEEIGTLGSRLSDAPGFLFPTRPLGVAELFAMTRVLSDTDGTTHIAGLTDWLFATRGFSADEWTASAKIAQKMGRMPFFPLETQSERCGKIKLALAVIKTETFSWNASVHGKPDLSRERYETLASLVRDVLRNKPEELRYLVFPELSIPAPWFLQIARKLQASGISLIAGVEYIHGRKGVVHNQVWASLVHDGLGFRTSAIYRQDKQHPAPAEEDNLWGHAGLKLKPAVKWAEPPVICHGDFRFALLICSELTNIGYRAALRGRVDALFVPEWNQDTHTFESLVESAALDMHAYIIQVNNREFGDSRVRAPRTKEWERDTVRVRGGLRDYFVVGEIDVAALRSFHSQYKAAEGGFKPLPDGFRKDFDKTRKVVPGKATKL